MANNKIIFHNDFQGGLDQVTKIESVSPSDYIYALNIRQSSTGAGSVGEITNILGNSLISFNLPAGTNKVIGAKADEAGNRVFYFVYNSQGYHSIFQYNVISGYIEKILQSKTDIADGSDILNFDPNYLILNPELIGGNLLYFVDQGRNPARKINISKIKDKSSTGYSSIDSIVINAFKRPPFYAPKCAYDNDKSRQTNKLYKHLFKFAYQFVYDDLERSTYSDFSAVPTPTNEPYNGSSQQIGNTSIYTINRTNNVINVTVGTGYNNVSQVNIVAQIDNLNWVLIAVLDKASLGLGDNGQYTYRFYNDGSYSAVDASLLIQPYSFLPINPYCQALINSKSMAYAGYYEGFDPFKINVTSSVSYYTLDQSSATTINTSTPPITNGVGQNTEVYNVRKWPFTINFNSPNPIVPGQIFTLTNTTGNEIWTYTVGPYDTPLNVGNYFSNLWTNIVSDKFKYAVIDDTSGAGPQVSYVGGILSFFIYKSFGKGSVPNLIISVKPTNYLSISNTNKTVKVNKTGSRVQYGIVYEDSEGRKTQVFTDSVNLNIYSNSIPELGSVQYANHQININHVPPSYAVRYQLVRTRNLTHASLLQFAYQAINVVTVNGRTDFLDVVIQGINTYHTIFPTNNIGYTFQNGDRMRFLYYPDPTSGTDTFINSNNFNEVEIVEQRFNTIYPVNATATLQGNTNPTIVVANTDVSKIGTLITVTNSTNQQFTRRITGVSSGTVYTIDSPIADLSVCNSYSFQDDRLILRVRNPNFSGLTGYTGTNLPPIGVVEIFTPSTENGVTGSLVYFEFGQKYDIINAGTPNALHLGPVANQTNTTPAIFNITEGDTYARLREMPKTNVYPGVTSYIGPIEDYNFSDFYPSLSNDNGRPEAEAPSAKKNYFSESIRYSQNFIPGSNINGISQFLNTDRKDYTDTYGDIKRLFYKDSLLYVFKTLRTGYSNVGRSLAYLADNTNQLVYTNKILEDVLHYYSWRGGIGNNPESFAENGRNIYFCSTNSGVALRLGGDGLVPISEIYGMDVFFKNILKQYSSYNGKIYGAFDRKNTEYIVAFENLSNVVYRDNFSGTAWQISNNNNINPTTFYIVSNPSHGTLSAVDSAGNITYTPYSSYSGSDSFLYTVYSIGGALLPTVKQCINVLAASRVTAFIGTAPTCLLDGSSNNTGYVSYATLSQIYTDNNALTGVTKPNTITIGGVLNPDYIAPYFDRTQCPNTTSISVTINYGAFESGSTVTLNGVTQTVLSNTAGTIAQSVAITLSTGYTIAVTVPNASTASATVNGATQTVTPAASGNTTLNFSYTGSASPVVVTITPQSTLYRGRQSDSVCEKQTKVNSTITGLTGPYSIAIVESVQRAFVSDYSNNSVRVIDTNPANVSTYNTIINTISGITQPRQILYNATTNLVYVISQTNGVYTINPNTYVNSPIIATSGALGFYVSNYDNLIYIPVSNLIVKYPIGGGSTVGSITLTGSTINLAYITQDTVSGNIYATEANNGSPGTNPALRIFVVASGASTQFSTITLPVGIGDTSRYIAFYPAGRTIYVVAQLAQKVFIIDTNPANVSTYNTIIGTVNLLTQGGNARYLSGTSSVYVAARTGSYVYQINPSTNVLANKGIAGVSPIDIDYSASASSLYTVNYDAGTMSVIPYPNSFVNDGNQVFVTLEQYFSGSLVLTGNTKPNVSTDPNYVAPVVNTTLCPIGV